VTPDADIIRRRLLVRGVVQGVGFRPFVYNLARELGLGGFVLNDARGVVVEAEGPAEQVAAFARRLAAEAPAAARVDEVSEETIAVVGQRRFVIGASAAGEVLTLVSPDLATCDECRRELFDPADRRRRYPFINCTSCGPRFTIINRVPYDRPATTMARFTMCAPCQSEYDDPADRRFHAQPNACAACGPRLALWDAAGAPLDAADPLDEAVRLLAAGAIVAVKGLGGYHLACDATNEAAVAALRGRKVREDKPFAVMARDEDVVRRYCELGDDERALLASPARPIVLLRKKVGAALAEAVAPGNRFLGVMLPYTPVHYLLLAREPLECLVMTSGNRADEPIAYRDEEVVGQLAGIADCYLTHDRPIARRVDDSVTRVVFGRLFPVRRSRGYVPLPIDLGDDYGASVLAVGAELKNTFCLTKGRQAFVSHHLGDLENIAALAAFEEGIASFRELFQIEPTVVARDLHPDYLASRYADALGLPVILVQHHHAHIASVLADAGYVEKVIGVAFDGAGLGDDGASVWGGEFLIADAAGYERAAHLVNVPLPGGDRAAREPWRMALAWLDHTYGAEAGDRARGARRGGGAAGPPGRRGRPGANREGRQRAADVVNGAPVRRCRGARRRPAGIKLRGTGGNRAGARGGPQHIRRLRIRIRRHGADSRGRRPGY
jgi:hydrogenase maturation protein HypF